MTNLPNNYQQQIAQEENNQIAQTIYLSRRAIWANILLGFLLSPLACYLHTRRWKALGIFLLFFLPIVFIISDGRDSFEANFQRGQNLSPLVTLIAIVDNSLAIKKAKNKVSQ
jgi:hypothetical protein